MKTDGWINRWMGGRLKPGLEESVSLDNTACTCKNWSCYKHFRQYIDAKVFEDICVPTNQQEIVVTVYSLNTAPEKIKTFFGVFLYMACHAYLRIKMYWAAETWVPIFTETMKRECFFKTCNSLKDMI